MASEVSILGCLHHYFEPVARQKRMEAHGRGKLFPNFSQKRKQEFEKAGAPVPSLFKAMIPWPSFLQLGLASKGSKSTVSWDQDFSTAFRDQLRVKIQTIMGSKPNVPGATVLWQGSEDITQERAHERPQEALITVMWRDTKEHHSLGYGPRFQKQHSAQPLQLWGWLHFQVGVTLRHKHTVVSPETNFLTDSQPIRKPSMVCQLTEARGAKRLSSVTQPNTHPQDSLSRRVRHSQQHPLASEKTRQSKKGYSHDISSNRRWHCVQPPSYPMLSLQPSIHPGWREPRYDPWGRSQSERMYYTTHWYHPESPRGTMETDQASSVTPNRQWPQQCVERSQGSQNPQVVSEKYKQISEPLEPPTQTVWQWQWASKEQPCSLNTRKPPAPLLSEDRERDWELNSDWILTRQEGVRQGERSPLKM